MTDNPQVNENQETPQSEPTSELVFGKYASLDEAQKGYWNAVEKLKATESEKAQLEAAVYQLLNERQNPQQMAQQRQQPNNPWERLAETEVPVDALQEAVRQETLKVVGNMLGPMANAWQAREFMVSKDPDFVKNEGEIMKFVNSDPQVKRTYDTLMGGRTPEEARAAVEWATLKWKSERAPVARVDRSADMAATSVPAPAGTSAPDSAQVVLDKLRAARETAVNTGDKEKLYELTWQISQMQQGKG